MMQWDKATFSRMAKDLGFVRDTFEKVFRLSEVLEFIQNDSFLAGRLALKGGTAINLTIFDLPRLSVDIDMDFCEDVARDEMLISRQEITKRIQKQMETLSYRLSPKSKMYHALDSFVYEYTNAGGVKDNLKIEINYMLRCHVLSPVRKDVVLPWPNQQLSVLIVDPLEIYASKIVALLNRAAPRDLFDVETMIHQGLFTDLQKTMLKKCVMFYFAIGSQNVPETFCFDALKLISQRRIKTDLVPVLRHGVQFDAENACEYVLNYLKETMKPDDQELMFWSEFNHKNYRPELLFQDESILSRISHHPMALWKWDKNRQEP